MWDFFLLDLSGYNVLLNNFSVIGIHKKLV